MHSIECISVIVCSFPIRLEKKSLTGFRFTCWLEFVHASVYIPQAKQSLDLFSWSGISDDTDYKRNHSKSQCFGLSFLGSHRGAVPEMIFADRLVPLAKLHLVNFITDAHMWFLQEGCPFLELIIAMHLEGKSLDMVKILSFIYL